MKKGIQPLDTMKKHETNGALLQTPHVLKKISVGNTGRKKNYFFFRDFSCFFSDRIFTKFLDRKKHTFSVLQKPNVFWKMQKTALKNVELEIFFQKKALKNVSLISKKRQKRQKRAKNSCFWGTCRKF